MISTLIFGKRNLLHNRLCIFVIAPNCAEQATAPASGTACGRDTGFADGIFVYMQLNFNFMKSQGFETDTV